MLKFSKKVEYALIALVYMSEKKSGELSTARELSEKFDISLELMGKLLQKLSKDSFIASIQGVKGGYYLLKNSHEITMGDVIQVIDGPIAIVDCVHTDKSKICDRHEYCNICKMMSDVQTKFLTIFNEITLEDFKKSNRIMGILE